METTHESSNQTLCSAQPAKPYAFSRKVFCEGMRDGVPIALGYFAVSFSLGIAARTAGFTPLQGFVAPGTPFFHRLIIGYDVTDELFGITIARPGYLNPFYTYGAIALAAPAWASGTALGIIAGNLLPLRAVSALSVALYGMFLAIIIPPARKDKIVAALVAISFALSFACTYLPGISALSDGTRTIILTVAISCAGALLFPVKTQSEEAEQ